MARIAYHYTNLTGLYEIVTTKSLLLTSLHAMNDPSEGDYTPDKFLLDFDEIEYPKDDEGKTKELFDILLEKVNEDKEKFLTLCKKDSEPYSTCFSTRPDSLSHWERYADDLKGVCISFDLDELEKLCLPVFNEFLIRQIIYSDKERSKNIGLSFVNMYNEMSTHLSDTKKDNFIDIIKKNSCSHLAAMYLSMVYFVKNEYWNEEDEIRLLYDDASWRERLFLVRKLKKENGFDFEKDYLLNQKHLGLNKTEFKNFSSIRTCKRLSLKNVWSEKLIPEIKIGSKSLQSKSDLRAFLDDNKLHGTNISESKIKIR